MKNGRKSPVLPKPSRWFFAKIYFRRGGAKARQNHTDFLRRRFATDKVMPITEFAFLRFGGFAGKFKIALKLMRQIPSAKTILDGVRKIQSSRGGAPGKL